MAGAFVQASAGVYNGFGGDAVDSLPAVTPGNALIAICVATADPTAIATSNFSGSGAFTKQVAGSALGGGLLLSVWDYYGTLSGIHTITATAVASSGVQMIVLEVSGIASFTAASTLAQGVSNSPTANSLTPVSGSWNLGLAYNGAAQTHLGWSPGTEIFDYAAWRGLAGSEYTAPSTSGIVTSASLGASDFWYAQTCSFAPSAASSVEQKDGRFYDDDAGESSATALAAQGANVTRAADQNTRIRYGLQATGDPPSLAYLLQHRINGGSWTNTAPPVTFVAPTFGAIGAGGSGTTSCTPSYPTGITAASALFCVVTGRSNTAATAPAISGGGWSVVADLENGTGTWGVDTGTRRVTIFRKDSVSGSESGTITVTLAGTTNNTLRASILRVETPTGHTLTVNGVTGADTSNDTGYSAAMSSTLALAADDLLLVATAQNIDTGTASSRALSATGITFGTITNRADTAVTNGNDHRHIVNTAPISSGSGTVTATFSYTISASGSGPTAIVRIRAVPTVGAVELGASSQIAASAATSTTQRLSGLSGTFAAGRITDDTSPLPSIDIGNDGNTELEWSTIARTSAGIANADEIEFRVVKNGGGTLDTYTTTLKWTIGSGGATMAAVFAGTGTLTANLSTAIRMSAALAGVGTISPALSTQIRMASTFAGTGSLAAALTTQIALASQLQGAGTLVAALLTEIRAAAVLNGAGSLAAALSTSITMATTWAGTGAIAANLQAGSGLAAALPGAGTMTPALSTAITLAAQLQGVATLTTDLSTAIRFAAALTSAATLAAALDTQIRLASALAGTGSVSAALATAIALASQLQGVASLAAALSTSITMASTWSGTGTIAANLQAGSGLAAQLAGAGTVQADLTTAIRLATTMQGVGTVVAAALTQIRMAAALSGAGTMTPALSTAIELRAAVTGAATLAAALQTQIALASQLQGAATLTGNLSTQIRLAAALEGVATLSANLVSYYIRLLSIAREGFRVSAVAGEALTMAGPSSERLDVAHVADETIRPN